MELIDILLSLITLTILEIVLGIDNLVFLSILTGKLPPQKRKLARRWGLTFAWVTRLLLLACAVWLAGLKAPIFSLGTIHLSIRDLFLLMGGVFLIGKATQEIHEEVLHEDGTLSDNLNYKSSFWSVVAQVAVMDMIFSLDSVLTAIGLTDRFWIMAMAISCAILVMIFASEAVSRFIEKYPTIKMLALSFLILIGMVLVADGLSFHVPRGYIYFSMGFSLSVEALNLIRSKKGKKRYRGDK